MAGDTPALRVLEHVLLSGESSRLYRKLIDQEELCLSVSGGLNGLQFDPSVFAVDCTLREGGDTAAVERVVYEELERLSREGPTEAEVAAAIAKLRVRFLRRMQTIDGQAELIGETAVFYGSWQKLRSRISSLTHVRVADVRRVALTYFQKRNRTVGTLDIAAESEDTE